MKNIIKKVLLSLCATTLLSAGAIGLVNAASGDGMPTQNTAYKINGRTIAAQGDNYLLNNAINLVDWVMSMLSVVTLVVLLIGGFKMITANGDDSKYKKGFTILKHAAIGLIIIGLSWAIIRLIFRFIYKTDTDATYDTNSP